MGIDRAYEMLGNVYKPIITQDITMWNKLKITRGSKEAKIFFSKGKAQYVKFTALLTGEQNIRTMNSVDVFTDNTNNELKIGFNFKENDEGMLKFTLNDANAGFISGASLFKEIAINGIPREQFAGQGYEISIEENSGMKYLVIKIPKR